jgi:ComF family protein
VHLETAEAEPLAEQNYETAHVSMRAAYITSRFDAAFHSVVMNYDKTNFGVYRSGTVVASSVLRRYTEEDSPGVSPRSCGWARRIAFSSSGNLTRATDGKVVPHESSRVASLVSGLNGVAAALFATLFPSDCRLCGAPLINISRLPVCDACLGAMRPIDGAVCSVCGERLISPYAFSDGAEIRCGLCQRAEPPYIKATAYGSYESGLRELIHLLKYDRVRTAANVLGRMLAEAIADLHPLFTEKVLLIPVPLYIRKLRQRGFNQSELIAREALKLARVQLELATDVLERRRETQSQIGLSRHQRRENMRGAFAVAKASAVSGREVLVVDDVFTTGTTVSECARVLRRAGASKVYVATVARTLKAEAQHAMPQFEPKEEVRVATAAAS